MGGGMGPGFNMTEEQMKKAAEMMKNPDALRKMQEQMASMSPEQFASMMNMREGGSRWTTAMAKEHLDMLKDADIAKDAEVLHHPQPSTLNPQPSTLNP
jgi:hypothetical protein